jgi:hypothetical protein
LTARESVVYSAGEIPIPGLAVWGVGSERWSTPPRVDGYSGVAGIWEDPSTVNPQPTFRLEAEYTDDEGDVSEPVASGLSLEDAVERARELSPVVLVGTWAVGEYSYMDAGREPYVPRLLPRFLG